MIKISNISNGKTYITFTYKGNGDEKKVEIAGSWNNWQRQNLRKKKNGEFYITKLLPSSKEYEFKYIIDGEKWEIDSMLPTISNEFGTQNSILKL